MAFLAMLGVVVLAAASAMCAIVPSTGQVVTGEHAECRAAALEVRFQLGEIITSAPTTDDPTPDQLQAFVLKQAALLGACQAPIVKGQAYIACRTAALEVRVVLLNLAVDPEERDIAADKINDLTTAQYARLDVCKVDANGR